MRHATFSVPTVSCGNCVKHIQKALAKLPAVSNAQVDLAQKRLELDFDESAITLETVATQLEKAGYPATTS